MESIKPKPIEQAYARAQLGGIVNELCKAKPGKRNKALHAAARKLGSIVVRGWLNKELAIQRLIKASTQNGLMDIDGERAVLATIRDGLNMGAKTPHAGLADNLADYRPHMGLQQRRRIFKTIDEANELIGPKRNSQQVRDEGVECTVFAVEDGESRNCHAAWPRQVRQPITLTL